MNEVFSSDQKNLISKFGKHAGSETPFKIEIADVKHQALIFKYREHFKSGDFFKTGLFDYLWIMVRLFRIYGVVFSSYGMGYETSLEIHESKVKSITLKKSKKK